MGRVARVGDLGRGRGARPSRRSSSAPRSTAKRCLNYLRQLRHPAFGVLQGGPCPGKRPRGERLREARTPFPVLVVQIGVLLSAPLLFLYKAQSDLGTTSICAVGIPTVPGWEVPPRTMLVILAAVPCSCSAADRSSVGTAPTVGSQLVERRRRYGDGYQIIRSYATRSPKGLRRGPGQLAPEVLYRSRPKVTSSSRSSAKAGYRRKAVVRALFLVFLWSGMRNVRAAPDNFGAMAAAVASSPSPSRRFEHGLCHWRLSHHGQAAAVHIVGGVDCSSPRSSWWASSSVSKGAAAPSVYDRRRDDLRIRRAPKGTCPPHRAAAVAAAARAARCPGSASPVRHGARRRA